MAILLATSGHSGVDRVMSRLIPEFVHRGFPVDLLTVANHGPHLDFSHPGLRRLPLGTAHVNTALSALVRYLRSARPAWMLTDKDRVNRVALLARRMSGVTTRLSVRIGTQVSINLEHRSALERQAQRLSLRHLYGQAYSVLVPSKGVADDLRLYSPGANVRVVHSPVVTPAMRVLSLEPLAHPWFCHGAPPVILGVGELSARKDFSTLLRAFAWVRRSRACRLLILGKGRMRDQLVAEARTLGVAEHVELAGFVINPYAYLASASAMVLSSHWEGMPLALVEALAVGCPVVSADCPSGPRELLDGGRYGPLVPVGDDVAMARAIQTVLDHPLPKQELMAAADPYRLSSSVDEYLEAMGADVDSLAA